LRSVVFRSVVAKLTSVVATLRSVVVKLTSVEVRCGRPTLWPR